MDGNAIRRVPKTVLDVEHETGLLTKENAPARTIGGMDGATWRLALGVGLTYFFVYFWRYPIFLLGDEILNEVVVTVWDTPLTLVSCLSLAFPLGFVSGKAASLYHTAHTLTPSLHHSYLVGKIPAVPFISSTFFYRHRLATLLSIFWVSSE
jgi:hypothetical protein